MEKFQTSDIPKSPRIQKLVDALYEHMPVIESARAKLITESYKETEGEPIITRRAKAFAHILHNIPIIIRDNELIVGSSTIAPRGCQTFPEFSYEWLEAELDTVATRTADPFEIAEETKAELKEADKYWKGKTTSELATSYMAPEAIKAIEHNIFTPGNYFYNGVGHVTVKYWEVLETGFEGIMEKAQKELDGCSVGDGNYARKSHFLEAVILSCKAVIDYAGRYAKLAQEMAAQTSDPVRKQELLVIAENCSRVPAKGAQNFYEACQSFWFVQQLLQMESSGHSISPGRFDQYMYPYYKKDMEAGTITREFAQELMDCIWVKLNDLNKCRDAASAEGFAGYSLFQNLIAGGQNKEGEDVTNDLSVMCIQASMHVHLPAPSLSVRVWNGSPHEFLIKAAELTRTGIGLPAYYNDEVIIPALQNRGLSLEDAREYNIIGCVEPQKAGKTEGWHDAAFFNMCRPLELVFSNGMDKGEMVGIPTGDVTQMKTFDEFFDAYKKQMEYCISLLVNADNAIDVAHAERCPLPFLSCMIDDCLKEGKSVQEGGAVYNFTGPQGFGIANMADGLFAIRKLVYEDKKVSMKELKEALAWNYDKGLDAQSAGDMTEMIMKAMQKAGRNVDASTAEGLLKTFMGMKPGEQKTQRFKEIHDMIDEVPKFGNDIPEVDYFAREVAYTYSKPLQKYNNPRGGKFQAGLYPVSANVPLGGQTGATPDGRKKGVAFAPGANPMHGRDTHGAVASLASVAKLPFMDSQDGISNTFTIVPDALGKDEAAQENNLVAMLDGYVVKGGHHLNVNVLNRDTLLDAQKHPELYPQLTIRVSGYAVNFIKLTKEQQDEVIARTFHERM